MLRKIPGSQNTINTIHVGLLDILLNGRYNVSAESSEGRWVRSRESIDGTFHGIDKVCLLISGSFESALFVNDNLARSNGDFISASLFNLIMALCVLEIYGLDFMLSVISSESFSWC